MERWLLLAILSLGWGSAYLFQDESVAEIGPLTLTAIRLVAAALLLFVVLRARGLHLPGGRREWLFFLAIGGIGNLLPFALTTWAQQDVKSSMAGILTAVVPLVTLVLAHFFGDERLTVRRTLGFLVGFAGVVVLLGPEAVEQGMFQPGGAVSGQLLAYAALLGAALCFAVTAIVSAKMPRVAPMAAATGVLIAAAGLTVPAALLFEFQTLRSLTFQRPTLDALGSAAILALIITPWATYAYFRLVARAGAPFLSLFNYFNPLIAVTAGVLVLGERLPSTAGLALALILAGVAISEFRRIVRAAESVLAG